MIEYFVQKEGVSDTSFTLTKKMFNNFDLAKSGDILCSYESSKASIDLESKDEGYVIFFHEIGNDLKIGDLICVISRDKSQLLEYLESKKKAKDNSIKKITKKAEILLNKNCLSPDIFTESIISEDVVLNFLNKQKSHFDRTEFAEKDLILIGGGGHAKQCFEILVQNHEFNTIGFIDDDPETKLLDLPYFGNLNMLSTFWNSGLKNVILGIGFNGNLKKRDILFNQYIKMGYNIPNIIHKDSSVSQFFHISGKGIQIMANCTIGPDVVLEDNVIINSGAVVSHDCKIGCSSHITPGAILGGNVIIGRNCTIGMGSNIYLGVKISDNTTIKNGESIYVSR